MNLELPTVEVRFENLHIETEVYAETARQLPSLWNAARSSIEVSGSMDCPCIICLADAVIQHAAADATEAEEGNACWPCWVEKKVRSG